jgi:hypothetical protein
MPRLFPVLSAVVAALAFAVPVVHAETITFSNLVGPQAQIVNSYAEGSYTVTSSSGAWGQDHSFGNPVPSVFSSSTSASIDVTLTGGGAFIFNSVDLGNGGTGSPSFFIQGFFNNNWILGISSSLPASNAFFTVPTYDNTIQIDTLRITMGVNDTNFFNVDNINVGAAVPEPASLMLLGTAVVPMLLRRRR